jgi:hypothetical protein
MVKTQGLKNIGGWAAPAHPPASYRLWTNSDDGVILWWYSGGTWQKLIDNPNTYVGQAYTNYFTLTAGQRYPIVLDYFEIGGNANIQLQCPPGTLADQTVSVAIGGCLTFNSIPRTIVCNWSATNRSNFPVHAFVHELGHVFTNRTQHFSANNVGSDERTRGLLYSSVQNTFNGSCSPSFSSTNFPMLFQNLQFPLSSCTYITDIRGLNGSGVVMGFLTVSGWRRGESGWGSGPDNVFTPFQMHPPDLFPNNNDETKIDETAADMFLNWVYRRRTNNPPTYKISTNVPGTWEGFRNSAWPNNSANAQNDANFPGDARFEWMNIIMGQIITLKGW